MEFDCLSAHLERLPLREPRLLVTILFIVVLIILIVVVLIIEGSLLGLLAPGAGDAGGLLIAVVTLRVFLRVVAVTGVVVAALNGGLMAEVIFFNLRGSGCGLVLCVCMWFCLLLINSPRYN